MSIVRHNVKSCCGNKSLIFETDKPIRKSQIDLFKQAGYLVPANFYDIGVFYVQKGHLFATAAFGASKINVRCSGEKCVDLLDDFSSLLEKAISS